MTPRESVALVFDVAALSLVMIAVALLVGAIAGIPIRRRRSRERGFYDATPRR